MGLAVVTVASGGLPVVESTTGGTPVTEAANGRGVPVTKVVGKAGMPVVFETIGVVASDPFFSSVKLLMGFNGADASTGAPGMTDESSAARGTATVVGAAQIDTAQFAVGTSSLLLDGTTSLIQFGDSPDWDLTNQPFTIECRFRANTITGGLHALVAHRHSAGDLAYFLVQQDANLLFALSTDGTNGFTVLTAPIVANTWYAAAAEFNGSKYRLYLNGVMVSSSTTVYTVFSSNRNLTIGSTDNPGARLFFNGWIDELRFTKGVARYSSDAGYTVSTTAFPRS